jgi:hypothetical protein
MKERGFVRQPDRHISARLNEEFNDRLASAFNRMRERAVLLPFEVNADASIEKFYDEVQIARLNASDELGTEK